MDIAIAWEGYIRQNLWTEARVSLKNEGADWQGELIIYDDRNQVTYRRPLELPAHSYKQYRVPLFVKDAMPTVALQDATGVQQQVRLSLSGSGESKRVVISADTRGPILATAPSDAATTLMWLPDLTGLPETPMAWDVIDVLLLNGIDTASLTPEQQEALLAWVGAGGHLIVGGGPALQQTLSNLAEPLRIAAPGDARIFAALPLKEATLNDVAGVTLLPQAKVVPLAMVEDAIVAARGTVGKGYVDVVGWDMMQPGSANWLVNLWSTDPVPAIATPLTGSILSTASPNLSTMLEIPYTFFSKLWGWLLLFPVYIFLIGPGTLILVRRLRKPILAWVFIPTWIIGAVIILAVGLSSAFSHTFPLVHEIAIIAVPDTALPARVVQGTAIYAPRIRNLTWNTAGTPRPMTGSLRTDNWYNEGEPFPVEVSYHDDGATIQTHHLLGVITWGTEGLYDSPAIESDLSITLQEGIYYFTGEIWSEASLHDVALWMGKNVSYNITLTQAISPATTVAISRPVTATSALYGSSAAICGVSNSYYYSSYGTPTWPTLPNVSSPPTATACYLTGLIDTVPFPADDIGGTLIQESCLIYSIPCPVQPQGSITATLENIADKTTNGWVDAYTHIAYGNAPDTTFEYVLPAYLDIANVDKLTVALSPAPEAGTLSSLKGIAEISVWNWVTKEWMDYSPEETIVLTGMTARQAFDTQQGVRVRISPTDNTFMVKLTVAIEGTR